MSMMAKVLSSLGLLLGALLCVVLGVGFFYLFACCDSPPSDNEGPLYLGGAGALACLMGSIAVWFGPTKK